MLREEPKGLAQALRDNSPTQGPRPLSPAVEPKTKARPWRPALRRTQAATFASSRLIWLGLKTAGAWSPRLTKPSVEFDILVNAAGMTDRGDILNTSPELFDKMFAVNARGPFFLMQESIRRMIRDNVEGAIVNIGSTSALAGQPFIAAYCGSKGALATLTRNTAFAVMRNRIRVNQLNIGWMASDGEDRIQREYHGAKANWLEQAAAEQPFGRLLAPEEVARAVNFLVSADSGMMTGSVINFDQSVWGAYPFAPPAPPSRMELGQA